MSVILLSTLTVDYTLPRFSAIFVTVETMNSTYVLEIASWSTTLTCTKGKRAGQTYKVDPILVDSHGVGRPLTGKPFEILSRPDEPNRPALVARLKERFEGHHLTFVSDGQGLLETTTVVRISV